MASLGCSASQIKQRPRHDPRHAGLTDSEASWMEGGSTHEPFTLYLITVVSCFFVLPSAPSCSMPRMDAIPCGETTMFSWGRDLMIWLKTWIPVSEPSSSRDRELNWEYTEDKVTVVKTKKGKCQFMVPSNKDSLRGGKKKTDRNISLFCEHKGTNILNSTWSDSCAHDSEILCGASHAWGFDKQGWIAVNFIGWVLSMYQVLGWS